MAKTKHKEKELDEMTLYEFFRRDNYDSVNTADAIKVIDNSSFELDDLFNAAICMTSKEFMKSNYIDMLDRILDTKEHADVLFRKLKSKAAYEKSTYLISHWIHDQPEPYKSEREDNWIQITDKLKEICKRIYGCAWGKQIIADKEFSLDVLKPEKYFDFDIEIMSLTKYREKLITDRPVYYEDKLIGHCKKFKNSAKLECGYKSCWDTEDFMYYNTPIYADAHFILFHESIDTIVKNINEANIDIEVRECELGYRDFNFNGKPIMIIEDSSCRAKRSGLYFCYDIEIKKDRVIIKNKR